jgi:formylglycine-generating enzyme required for sulfatase activity
VPCYLTAQDAGISLIDTPEKANAAQAAWAAKLGKPVQWTNAAGMKFQLIPPGEFDMGVKDGDKDAPLHRVKLTEPFYLGTYEVTRAEWEKIMKGKNSNFFPGPTHPMNHTHAYQADGFCAALSKLEGITNAVAQYRLPTEAEWEFACRAGMTTEPELDKVAWYEKNSGGTTHPVGQKTANAFGLYDMLGNVWEWTGDFYDTDFYTKGPKENPSLPKDEYPHEYRVVRGGSCFYDAKFCTTWHRDRYEPSRTLNNLGLRVVLPIKK